MSLFGEKVLFGGAFSYRRFEEELQAMERSSYLRPYLRV